MRGTELIDIERAYELVAKVLMDAGDEGEHLALPGFDASKAHTRDIGQAAVHKRLAICKSLQSTRDLLSIALQLMSPAEARSAREFSVQKRAMLQALRSAARRTYEAGHLLVGVDLGA